MRPAENVGIRLDQAGWRTGAAVFGADLIRLSEFMSARARANMDEFSLPAVGYICSQCCDLVHNDLEQEPFAELILAETDVVPNPDRAERRSFRHLQIQVSPNRYIEFSASNRVCFPRELIIEFSRNPTLDLSWEHGLQLAGWLGARYARLPLPNELVKRLPLFQDPAKKHFKRISDAAFEFRIKVVPAEGLPPDGQPYFVHMSAIMRPGLHSETISKSQDWLKDWLKKLPGVNVQLQFESADSFSYARFQETRRLDLDRFTFGHSSGPQGLLPANE